MFQCAGGWLGYFSYGTATERYALKKRLPFSCAPEDDRNLPDVHFGLYDDVIVFDHVEKVFVRKSYPIYQVPSLVQTYQIDTLTIVGKVPHIRLYIYCTLTIVGKFPHI